MEPGKEDSGDVVVSIGDDLVIEVKVRIGVEIYEYRCKNELESEDSAIRGGVGRKEGETRRKRVRRVLEGVGEG